MLTAYRTQTIVPSDGRIEIQEPAFKPGTRAEVIVLVEQPAQSEVMQRIAEWRALFEQVQALPQAQTLTEEEIAAEIAAYRAEK